MDHLLEILQDDFVVCDLGSSGKETYAHFRPVASTITLIELDAAETMTDVHAGYRRRVSIKSGISGREERRRFFQRKFVPCSSFLQPDEELVHAYGLEQYFELDRAFDIECTTLDKVVSHAGVRRIDFLKTDLEGVDCEILKSAPGLIENTLVIQCELRLQPLYRDEPGFCETVAFLSEAGFELITLRPEVWKYKTRNRDLVRDGRLAWADFVFVLQPAKVRERFGENAGTAFCKQIVISRALGLKNYAEYLYEKTRSSIPSVIQSELVRYINDEGMLRRWFVRTVNRVATTALGRRVLSRTRSILARASSILAIDKDLPHLGEL